MGDALRDRLSDAGSIPAWSSRITDKKRMNRVTAHVHTLFRRLFSEHIRKNAYSLSPPLSAYLF